MSDIVEFIDKYDGHISKDNYVEVIRAFEYSRQAWASTMPYMYNGKKNMAELYGDSVGEYATALLFEDNYTQETAEKLSQIIERYDESIDTKYFWGLNSQLFELLSRYWMGVGRGKK